MLTAADITVRFGDRTVLDNMSIELARGEVVALVGPSGVGKSTLLRVLAGLLAPDHGKVILDARDITSVPTHQRNIGMMFQNEQLFPHLSVAKNVGFGLRMQHQSREVIADRVAELLQLVGLTGFGDRDTNRLSGGESKRVALARALAPKPIVLLLDEPLTGLDRELHDRLANDLTDLLRTTGTTALLVTHDADEAGLIADRTVTMKSL